MTRFGLDDFSAEFFLSPPVTMGAKATFDAGGFMRALDAIIQGWFAGKLALAEGDLLPAALGNDGTMTSYATRVAIISLLADVEGAILPKFKGQVLAIATRFPELLEATNEAAGKLDDRIALARAAGARLAADKPVTPLRGPLNDYSSAYTGLNLARARVPADAAAVDDAKKQLAVHFDGVTRAHDTFKGGFAAITAAANRFGATLANLPAAKVTPAQRRTTQEYAAIIAALKNAWALPAPLAPAAFPASRGKSLVNRVFAALRRSPK